VAWDDCIEEVRTCQAKCLLGINVPRVSIFDPGDEIIIPSPYWVSYPDQVLLNDATPVIVETTEAEGFKLSAGVSRVKSFSVHFHNREVNY